MQYDSHTTLRQALNEGPLEFRECWRRLPYRALLGDDVLSTLARCGRVLMDRPLPDNPTEQPESLATDTLEQLGTQALSPAYELERLSILVPFSDTRTVRAALHLALRQGSAPHISVIYSHLAMPLMFSFPRTARGYFWSAYAAALLCDNPLYRERALSLMHMNSLLSGADLQAPGNLRGHSEFSHQTGHSRQTAEACHLPEVYHQMKALCHAGQSLRRRITPTHQLMAQVNAFPNFLAWPVYLSQQLLHRGEAEKAQTLLLDFYEHSPQEIARRALLTLHQSAPLEAHWCTFFEFDTLRKTLATQHQVLPCFDFNTLVHALGQEHRMRPLNTVAQGAGRAPHQKPPARPPGCFA